MSKIDHKMVLQTVVEKYERENGILGLTKADVDNMIFSLGGDVDDVYTVMELGMELLFGDMMGRGKYLN